MKYTSINHDKTGNYQINYEGFDRVRTIDDFETECRKKDYIWSKLFIAQNGQLVASYDILNGLNKEKE